MSAALVAPKSFDASRDASLRERPPQDHAARPAFDALAELQRQHDAANALAALACGASAFKVTLQAMLCDQAGPSRHALDLGC
ncbi:MAG: hypothetical protein AAGJ87_17185, partial [Pseudomonadota bacterium]